MNPETNNNSCCGTRTAYAAAILGAFLIVALLVRLTRDYTVALAEQLIVDYEEEDEAGLVHSGRDLRVGEAWERGPLVISLRDVHAQPAWEGYNVVIHECAHKLDMRNGSSDGFPPLHRDMSVRHWTGAFTQAYEDLRGRIERDEETPVDEYAAESPAECFAVFSEYFFEAPHILRAAYPAVYEQLVQFYRQDSVARLGRVEGVGLG